VSITLRALNLNHMVQGGSLKFAGKRFDWVDIGLDLVNIFLSKTTKK
jgi:ABC-type arginine transport system ATPase subunit